jgi:hypothetical protein
VRALSDHLEDDIAGERIESWENVTERGIDIAG